MVVQLRGAVGRFRKLKAIYLVVCLTLQFISDVSTTDSIPKNVQSSVHFKDSTRNTPNKSTMQRNLENGEKILARNSRATSELELSSIFSEDGKMEDGTIKKEPYMVEENSEITSEQVNDGLNDAKKRNNDASLIPFPRLGRSKVDPNLIMPYPDSWLIPYLSKTQNKLNEINALVFDVEEEFENSEYFSENRDNEDSIMEEEVSPDNEEFQFDSITERQADNNGTVIPYPRLGKRDVKLSEKDTLKLNQNPSTRVKRTTDSIIPQIRYGRSTQSDKLSKPEKQSLYILPNYRPGRSSNGKEKSFKYSKNTKPGILPYPRPGRSEGESVKRQTYILPQPRFGRSLVESKDIENMEMILKLNPLKNDKLTEDLIKSGESQLFLIPYPRPGKRFFGTKPLPPNVNLQIKDKDYVSNEDNGDKEQVLTTFLVPYPRPGRSESNKQYLIPNARFGKSTSETMLPLPRYGRSGNKNIMLPYPRPGRSVTLIPQARFGRSNILPYPRLGRSLSSVLPYPRPGRSSSSVLPYPRLGRSSSSSVLPYPRLGRSAYFTSVIPQLRVGKSSSLGYMIPQMRVGKSASATIIPQMRVGKAVSSGSIIPQMRVGKSSSSLPFMGVFVDDGMPEGNDVDLSEEQVQHQQKTSSDPNNFQTDSKNNLITSAVLIPAKKLQKHMLSAESNYMLPYPRPGRLV